MESELQILISAVDEASETIAGVGESVTAMGEEVMTATNEAADSFAEFGLQVNATTGEIEDAMTSTETSMAAAAALAEENGEEIMQVMMDTGVSAQEAAAVIAEANAEIASSSEEAAEATSLSKSSFTAVGVAAAIAFTAVASAVSSAISSAEQWNQTSEIISQELKDIGSSVPLSAVQAYAQQLQSTTLFSQQQALSAEAVVLGFKDLAPQYQNLTLLSADLATKIQQFTGSATADLPSAMKILTNALNDPVAGLAQLQRQAGVDIPAATVTMIKNLATVGDTSQADAVILQALNEQVGGLADAAANAQGGALTQLQNQLTALGTVIGNDLLPLLTMIAKDLEPVIKAVTRWAQEHPKLTDAIIAGTVAFTAFLAVMAVIGIIVAALGSAFVGTALLIAGIGAAVAILAVFLATNWATIQADALTVWTDITAFLSATWSTITNALTVAWDAIADFFKQIWNAMSDAAAIEIDLVIGAIIEALDTFDPQWRTQWHAISDFFTETWTTLKSFIQGLWTWITGTFNTGLSGINEIWNTVWGGISSFFIGIWNNIESTLLGALSTLRTAISSFVSWAEGVFQPVENAINGIGGAVSGFLKTTINIGASVTGIQDAIITPGGDIIQSDPADYLIATKTPGSLAGAGGSGGPTIQVFIQGGNYLDSNGATMIGNALAKQIVQQLRVRNYQP